MTKILAVVVLICLHDAIGKEEARGESPFARVLQSEDHSAFRERASEPTRDYSQFKNDSTVSEEDRRLLLDRMHQMRQRGSQGRLEQLAGIVTLPAEMREHLRRLADAVERERRNPFDGSDLRVRDRPTGRKGEEEDDEDEEEEEEQTDSEGSTRNTFSGDKAEYCRKYHDNYEYYCVGDTEYTPNIQQVVRAFCPAYKAACGVTEGGHSASLSTWPKNPFEKEIVVNPSPTSEEVAEAQEKEREEQQTKILAQLKKRFPCKPDCDQRIFKHCTAECKCDFMYPYVQNFCNPPPMPFFLNTCRLWYHGCPKYEQFHYNSQFFYSKAEKGKTLPGPTRNPNPFGLPQPAPSHLAIPRNVNNKPSLPLEVARALRAVNGLTTEDQLTHKQAPADLYGGFIPGGGGGPKRRGNTREFASETTVPRNESSLIVPPAPFQEKGEEEGGGFRKVRAKAQQSPSFPVLPSDAGLAAGSDPFHSVDALTDSKGILHRPRSRSPFSKPGLWEPNPDNPHNREHHNKFWYRPESVNVDWLNGQVNWGAHWAVPAMGIGGTQGYSALFFPSIGNFFNIPDDYD